MTTSTAKHRAAKAAKARARHKAWLKTKREAATQVGGNRSLARAVHLAGIRSAYGHRAVKWHPHGAGVIRP